MILVFGSINIDLVARVASIPRPGETVLSPRYETLFGGKGANQAIAAARASLPRSGDDRSLRRRRCLRPIRARQPRSQWCRG